MRTLIGEMIGTMVLVFIGCGTVAIAVLFGALNLYGVALFFGAGVTAAIYVSKSLCPAHLNPAVSFAFLLRKDLSTRKFLEFILAQLVGAFIGAVLLFLIFNNFISEYELSKGIVRGEPDSYHSAVMFGEFFPNPGFEKELRVSHWQGIFWEALGTFILMTIILNVQRLQEMLRVAAPVLVGLTVTILIVFIAPYTQGGFNPARDFGPRVMAYIGGWGDAVFPSEPFSFFTVYILGPIVGAGFAVPVFRFIGLK